MLKSLSLLILIVFFSLFLTSSVMSKDLHCPNCGVRVESTDEFCPDCGAQLYCSCPKCGAKVKVSAFFCPKCGAKLKNKLFLPEMVYIKGGTFYMGNNDNGPVHQVTVSGFYMGKFEITNREYASYNSKHKGKWSDADYPVESVSWNDAVNYCKWLSEKTKKTYRLPTEAEWEYACRGGTSTEFYWGNKTDGAYFWYCKNSENQVHAVGKKKANPFGLYDMSGNVCEWCIDVYNYYSSMAQTNPVSLYNEQNRMFRGGGWNSADFFCFSAYRGNSSPGNRFDSLGFRVVMLPSK